MTDELPVVEETTPVEEVVETTEPTVGAPVEEVPTETPVAE